MHEVYYLSATQLAKEIKTKKISAVQVMKAHLEQIEKVNPLLNALVQRTDPDRCLHAAQLADEAIEKKLPVGKMHGVPITIKDTCHVEGLYSCCASGGLWRGASLKDATVVTRLKAEGGIVLGLTNVPELLCSFETNSKMYGQANNPYNIKHTPGGSSGGCAALVAAGGSPFSIGSDAGGSIRWPAHCTGIAGLKPTQGRVPNTGNTLGDARGLFSHITTFGPLARYVEDLYLGLQIISGQDESDPYTHSSSVKDPSKVDLKSLKVAYFTDDGLATPTNDIQKVVQDAARALKEAGLSVEEAHPPMMEKTLRLLWELFFLGGDAGKGLKAFLKNYHIDEPSPLFQTFVHFSEQCVLGVEEVRLRFIELDMLKLQMMKFMRKYDLILSPVAATVAKKHGETFKEISHFSYGMFHNLTGWPCVVVRCGTSNEGLPIGVQIAAKAWHEENALAAAMKLEASLGGWQPPPCP